MDLQIALTHHTKKDRLPIPIWSDILECALNKAKKYNVLIEPEMGPGKLLIDRLCEMSFDVTIILIADMSPEMAKALTEVETLRFVLCSIPSTLSNGSKEVRKTKISRLQNFCFGLRVLFLQRCFDRF